MANADSTQTGGLTTLLHFLIGRRDAIETIASDRRWLGVGFVFVLAAGMAREYDAEYLIAEPWYALIPVAASVAASLLLYAFVYAVLMRKSATRPPFLAGYVPFLTLFWMTAPLALLYAIPFERFCGEYDATIANLWLLAIVALWRVVLFTRVTALFTGASPAAAFFPVMLFAGLTIVVGIIIVPQPLIGVMSGVSASASVVIVHLTSMMVMAYSILLMPIWIIGTLWVAFRSKPGRGVTTTCPIDARRRRPPWPFAAICLAMWIPILPFTQPEQQRRHAVEALMGHGDIHAALSRMSEFQPGDFPPHYDPRPRPFAGQNTPEILDIMHEVAETPPAPWVREIYLEKFRRHLSTRFGPRPPWSVIADVLEKIPEGPELAGTIVYDILDNYSHFDEDEPADTEGEKRIRALATQGK